MQFIEPDWHLLLQVLISMACGAVLGCERERSDHSAGIRTIMLITVGACIFMAVGREISNEMVWRDERIRIDPGRLASYVVAGIGFLGAGPIIAQHGRVRGLTTAATIWVAAAIGLLVGLDSFASAVALSLLIILVVRGLRPFGHYLNARGPWSDLYVTYPDNELQTRMLRHFLDSFQAELVESEPLPAERRRAHIRYPVGSSHVLEILRGLMEMPEVRAWSAEAPDDEGDEG